MRKYIVALILTVICGCSPRIYEPIEIEHISDTVVRERVIHDSVYFEVQKEVERIVTRDTVSHLENSWAKSDAVVSGGMLTHSLESKPQKVYVPYYVEVHDTTVVNKDTEVVVQKVNELTQGQSIFIVTGKILLSLAAVALVLSILVVYLKFKKII